MKKMYLFAAAAMTLAACSQEEILNGTIESQDVDMNNAITAVIATDANSRLSFTEVDGALYADWAVGDAMQGMDAQGNFSTFKCVSIEDDGGAMIGTFGWTSGSAKATEVTTAIFPANEANKKEGDIIKMTLPTSYANDAEAAIMPMVGTIESQSATFDSYLTGALNIRLKNTPAGYDRVKIWSDHKCFAGEFNYDTTNGKLTGGTSSTVEIEKVNNLSSFYIPMPVTAEYKYLQMSLKNAEGKELPILGFASPKIKAGQMKTVTLDFKELAPAINVLKPATAATMTDFPMSSWIKIEDEGTGSVSCTDGVIEISNPEGKENWKYTSASMLLKDIIGTCKGIHVTADIMAENTDECGVQCSAKVEETGKEGKVVLKDEYFPIDSWLTGPFTNPGFGRTLRTEKPNSVSNFATKNYYIALDRTSPTWATGGAKFTSIDSRLAGKDVNVTFVNNNAKKGGKMWIKNVHVSIVR